MEDSQASDSRHPKYKPLSETFTRDQANSNGSRSTNNKTLHVPTIDRRIQHPPPEPAELNRILAQVPGILKDLDEKQAEVIRSLARKVNHQGQEIENLKASNVELNDHITTSNNLMAELRNKVEGVEEKMSRQIGELEKENEELREHIDRTGVSLVAQVKREIEKLKQKLTVEDDYEPGENLTDDQDPEKTEEEDASFFLQ